ncbi:MAG: ABC transporter ATP-binding protein [Cyclobacteriaceae bacterium]|nr:ABC transporter ATP-binding protein [Cyclobacteriaceae bacterium]
MIEIHGIEKRFGRLEVLKGFDLSVEPGKITAILGPNGSGKTTLIKSILGLVIPNGGKITYDGQPIANNWQYRRHLGYLPQIARFPENLTVKELIALIEEVRGEKGQSASLIQRFDLQGFQQKKLRQLSGGTRQKVNLVLTFMFDCPIYILDEPTSGLDPIALIRLKDLITEQKLQGKTFLLTTHIMSLVEEIADQLVFLLEGKVYFRGTHRQMLQAENESNLERAIAKILEKEHAENP